MKKYIKTVVASVLVASAIQSCTKANVTDYTVDNCSDTIHFATEILPLMVQNCATSGCHDAGTQAAGYDLTTHASISGSASIVLSAIRWEGGTVPMPQGNPQLADSLVNKFSCWINQGKLDN